MSMKNMIGEEVFVVGIDNVIVNSGPLDIFSSYEEVIDHLNGLNPIVDSDTKIVHGVLTSAEILPDTFDDVKPFIIIKDPDDGEIGSIIEIEDDDKVEDLADRITDLVAGVGNVEVACLPEIDDIFVLYGYEIDVVLSITEDSMDEQQIETGKKVFDSIEEIRMPNNKTGYIGK